MALAADEDGDVATVASPIDFYARRARDAAMPVGMTGGPTWPMAWRRVAAV